MNKKNLILMAGAYFVWVSVASAFSKKKENEFIQDLEKKCENKEPILWALFQNFIEIHETALSYSKEKVATPENLEKIEKLKSNALDVVENYKKEGEILVEELKAKGSSYSKEVAKEIEDLYEEKKSELEKMKKEAPKTAESMKKELVSSLKELLDKVKEIEKKV